MSMLNTMFSAFIFCSIFALAVWIFLKIKKGMSKSKTPKPPVEEGDKKVDPKSAQTSTNLLKVMIFRPLSDGLVAQVGDPIMCEEKPDPNNNLIVMNEEKRFKEDFNFNQDRIFEMLTFSLQKQKKNKKDKLTIITNAIKIQEELVNSIATKVKENETYNALDEKLKLRQLKVLRESLQMEVTGNYMRLGKGGIRQYEFVVIDGILYPYFFGSRWYRVYPDLLIKKKIFNQENTIFRNEVGNLQKNIMNWLIIIVLVIGMLMVAGGGWMMKHAYSQNSEMTLIANQGAISCTNTLAKINDNYGTIIEDYQGLKMKESENIISPELPNINMGGIKIDPSKIGN